MRRYLDSIADDDCGPGRGGCSMRDEHGEVRSFRPLRGAELERYCALRQQIPELLDGEEDALAFYLYRQQGCFRSRASSKIAMIKPMGRGATHSTTTR